VYRLVLGSNRDGSTRGYSIRADGSRLTPLLGGGSSLVPATVSADSGTISYVDRQYDHPSGIYVSRASGASLRRVVTGPASGPVLSRDGRLIAFTRAKPGIWIVGTGARGARRLTNRQDGSPDWSPDGKALVFFRQIGDFAGAVVVQPLHGTQRVVAWSFFADPTWSPDGRWVAYKNEDELWLVKPNGAQRHRIARRAGAFAWAPEGSRLAFAVGGDVAIVGVHGRGRRRIRKGSTS
jgi:Tol biopolymer transport system component